MNLVDQFKSLHPQLRGETRSEWGAENPSTRTSIRETLEVAFHDFTAKDRAVLNDLSLPPRPDNWSISISHADGCGGWLAVPRPTQIGWDVELKSRVVRELIERIAKPEEITKAARPEFLWSAKEAYFKALEDDQPVTFTPLTLSDWRRVKAGLWSCRGYGPRNGHGLVAEDNLYLYAAFVIE